MRWIVLLAILAYASLAQAAALGSNCVLSWTPPTTNADNSPLTDLAKYRLYWSTTTNAQVKGHFQYELNAPAAQATCVAAGVTAAGTYFVKSTAVDQIGNESSFSNEISFLLDPIAPSAPSGLTAR